MQKTSFLPHTPLLSSYINRIYVLESKDGLPEIIPGTGLELLFHLKDPFLVNNQSATNAHIICPRKAPLQVNGKNTSFISVRFKSGAFRHFSPIPFSEFNDQIVSIFDIWGKSSSNLLDKIWNAKKVEGKIHCIEVFLMDCFTKYHNAENQKWDIIIHTLYKQYDLISIPELSTYTQLSFRQFERNFKKQFGVNPKQFQRITRFQDTLKKLLLHKNHLYLDTALDNGYYDQSHFIKEFKYYTNSKPKHYLNSYHFKNHFYYPSLSNRFKKSI